MYVDDSIRSEVARGDFVLLEVLFGPDDVLVAYEGSASPGVYHEHHVI